MKLTKQKLKQLIVEMTSTATPAGTPNTGAAMHMAPNQGAYLKNYPGGKPPDPTGPQTIGTRPPYETLGVESHIEEGEVYITIGKTQYQLVFDSEDLTSGRVMPIGEYKFNIDNGVVNWVESVPTHVRFDSHLEKQILDFSGREE